MTAFFTRNYKNYSVFAWLVLCAVLLTAPRPVLAEGIEVRRAARELHAPGPIEPPRALGQMRADHHAPLLAAHGLAIFRRRIFRDLPLR